MSDASQHNRRRMTFGEATDRLLLAAMGAIFLWFGAKVDDLTKKVENLLQTMSAVVAKQDMGEKRLDKLESVLDDHVRVREPNSGH